MDYAKEKGMSGSIVNISDFTVFTATDCMGKKNIRNYMDFLVFILFTKYFQFLLLSTIERL